MPISVVAKVSGRHGVTLDKEKKERSDAKLL